MTQNWNHNEIGYVTAWNCNPTEMGNVSIEHWGPTEMGNATAENWGGGINGTHNCREMESKKGR